jgi:tRNA(Ile)-lysidine synthase
LFNLKSLITPHLIKGKKCFVAYSGGVDSTVLLNEVGKAANELNSEVEAVHVNHGYSKSSESWEEHCKVFCKKKGFSFKSFQMDSKNLRGASLESLMRERRYEIFQKILIDKTSLLFMGHHLDDQIETLFFRLIRGTGLKGASSIPLKRNLGNGFIVRPFLKVAKEEIIQNAIHNNLSYVEDDSNNNNDFDRNYLRNIVIPKISERWPNYRKSISKSIDNQKNSFEFLTEISKKELAKIVKGEDIKINELKKYDVNFQKILILSWLENKKCNLPNSSVLEEIINKFIHSEKTSCPKHIWGSKNKGNEVCLMIKKGIMSVEAS